MESKIDEIVLNIKNKGYYVIKNYYSIEQCNDILKDMDKINKKDINKGMGNDLRINNFENISNGAKNFLQDSFLLNIGNSFLNHKADRIRKRCQLGVVKYYNNLECCSGGGWHVDNHNPQFKALLYLTNVNINNGPLAVISPPITSKDYNAISLKENTRFSNQIEEDYKHDIHYLTGNIGDLILVNTQNIHRGTIIKEGVRYSLTNYYYD